MTRREPGKTREGLGATTKMLRKGLKRAENARRPVCPQQTGKRGLAVDTLRCNPEVVHHLSEIEHLLYLVPARRDVSNKS